MNFKKQNLEERFYDFPYMQSINLKKIAVMIITSVFDKLHRQKIACACTLCLQIIFFI